MLRHSLYVLLFVLTLGFSGGVVAGASEGPFYLVWDRQLKPLSGIHGGRPAFEDESGQIRVPRNAALVIRDPAHSYREYGIPLLSYSVTKRQSTREGVRPNMMKYKVASIVGRHASDHQHPNQSLLEFWEEEALGEGTYILIAWWDTQADHWLSQVHISRLDASFFHYMLNIDTSGLRGYPCLFLYREGEVLRPQNLADDPRNALFRDLVLGKAPPDELPGVRDNGGLNMLGIHWVQWAAAMGRADWLEKLRGQSLSRRDYFALNPDPMLLAGAHGHGEAVRVLVEMGFHVQRKDAWGFDAGQYAAQSGHVDVMVELMKGGYNPRNTARDGLFNATHLALDSGHDEVFKLLVEQGGTLNRINRSQLNESLAHHSRLGNPSIVRYLLTRGADPYAFINDRPILEFGVWGAHPQVVKVLGNAMKENRRPQRGAPVKDILADALSLAVSLGLEEIVKILIDQGADPNVKGSRENRFPLALAIVYGHPNLVRYLLEQGADPTQATSEVEGMGTVEIATILGSKQEVEVLFEAGAVCLMTPQTADYILSAAMRYDILETAILAFDECVTPGFRLGGIFSLGWVAEYFQAHSIKEWLNQQSWEDNELPENLYTPREVDTPPELISASFLDYPEMLYRRHGNLNLRVMLIVDESGDVHLPLFLGDELPASLRMEALSHVERWRFQPAKKDGRPVKVIVQVPIELSYEAPSVYELRQLDQAPRVVLHPTPEYPQSLQSSRMSGLVRLTFVVNTEGKVEDVEVVYSTHPFLAYSARAAVQQWRFRPGMIEEKAVPSRVNIVIPFNAL